MRVSQKFTRPRIEVKWCGEGSGEDGITDLFNLYSRIYQHRALEEIETNDLVWASGQIPERGYLNCVLETDSVPGHHNIEYEGKDEQGEVRGDCAEPLASAKRGLLELPVSRIRESILWKTGGIFGKDITAWNQHIHLGTRTSRKQ